MKLTRVFVHGAIFLALAAPAGFAQSTTGTSTTATDPPTIQERKENQQDRIANGVKNGTLSPRETANLENKEAALNKEERHMRAADDGKLTAADRAKINRQQNRLSRQIYNKKHDIHSK